jgi:hypothetical protein
LGGLTSLREHNGKVKEAVEGSGRVINHQPLKRVTMMEALWPPKPKELLMTPFMGIARAVFGT